MTNATSAPGFPILKGVQNAKEIAELNAFAQSAAAALNKLWSDTFKTNAGIDAGNSTGYTYQGTPNFNVVKQGGGNPDFYNATAGSYANNYQMTTKDYRLAQSFTPSTNYKLIGIRMFACRYTGPQDPDGSLVAKLYLADANGYPTGSVLATSTNTIAVNTLGTVYTNPATQLDFTFSGYNVSSGTKYAIEISTTGSTWTTSGYIRFCQANNATAIGVASVYNGSSWSVPNGYGTTYNFYFKTTSEEPTAAVIQSVRALNLAAAVTLVMVFVDATLNAGALSKVEVSTDDGTTWTDVTASLGTIATVPSGQQIKLRVTITVDASLDFWGVAA